MAVWPRKGTFSGVHIVPGGTYDVKGQSLPETLAQSYPYVPSAISQPNCLVAKEKCLQLERAAILECEYQKKSRILQQQKLGKRVSSRGYQDTSGYKMAKLQKTRGTRGSMYGTANSGEGIDLFDLPSGVFSKLNPQKSTDGPVSSGGMSNTNGGGGGGVTADDSDTSSTDPPSVKRRKTEYMLPLIELDTIVSSISSVERLMVLVSNMQQSFQCVVCRSMVTLPVVAKCCGRIVGCQQCVTNWQENHTTCPLCASALSDPVILRGFDEVTKCINLMQEQHDFGCSGPGVEMPASSSESDLDLPMVNLFRQQ